MRPVVVLRGVVLLLVSFVTYYIVSKLMTDEVKVNKRISLQEPKTKKFSCNMETSCPEDHFPFSITSGAASVVGPNICFNGKILMSSVKNNIGKGINIALVNATTGQLLKTDFFDMWSGKVELLVKFLKSIQPGTVVLLASFDDAATKMNDEARGLFSQLGSSLIFKLHFRDNWVFLGAKPIKEKSPFEQILENDKKKNKYDNWPEALEINGCVPRKKD
ncbi:protein FAM3C-like isoform X1 [Hypanus sabinus]|uniref:protein FAM3C-like isoform X1 n=2 Tax=Hypanus sabinus TaxID=79690 RepID=UPI0028C4CBC5|nr:protein FAM3C-like isoform X1 [Hypanus sabinus]XP_059800213.1 protein FAM3C-like isoform X1 [Hypanus sabinus]XP_059800214.1 protein FAM3C-like isoform X1 [Hypanus sabinus]XP_059800215.1 protein FAM3C-like isoform X1 [Hypanus sabinus]XP_059800216.1 protein FAM3C-like isoform X1 [Hypanus sabinus]